jgi:hypothetical protein
MFASISSASKSLVKGATGKMQLIEVDRIDFQPAQPRLGCHDGRENSPSQFVCAVWIRGGILRLPDHVGVVKVIKPGEVYDRIGVQLAIVHASLNDDLQRALVEVSLRHQRRNLAKPRKFRSGVALAGLGNCSLRINELEIHGKVVNANRHA